MRRKGVKRNGEKFYVGEEEIAIVEVPWLCGG